MNTSLGRTLSHLRKLRGLTQAELAERLSVSQPIMARWENGRARPNDNSMARVAEALGRVVRLCWQGKMNLMVPCRRSLTRSRVREALQGRKEA